MPRRRRGQEARRAERRASRASETRTPWEPTEDEVWTEHQAYERHRRSPIPLDEQQRQAERRARTTARVRQALEVVLADFERWRR